MGTLFQGPIKNYGIATLSVIVTALLGSHFTSESVQTEWYDCVRPSWSPPNVVFPIAWSILYLLLALSFGLSLERRYRLESAFILNLCLNVAWCYLFFSKKALQASLGTIIALLGTIWFIIYKTGWQRENGLIIAALMIPYALWISFASILNWQALQNVSKCQNTSADRR